MAFQIVHFRNVGHQAALPTILRKKVLGYVLFSPQPDLCQTFAVYHHFPKSCKPLIGHTLAYSTRVSGGATKTHQPPRAALVEEAAPKVCRKLTVPSSFFRSCKLPLKILQSRLHIIRTSFQNVKPLCLRRLGLSIIHRMKRVKSFQPHSGFGVSTFRDP